MVVFLGAVFGVYYVFFAGSNSASDGAISTVAYEVATGTVSTGITVSGKIAAAQILDLNVYKLANRIDTVTIGNGSHVEKGQLLFAFDQSDAFVDVENAALALRQAALVYDQTKVNATDPNTTIASLQSTIAGLKTNIAQSRVELKSVQRDFFNADLKAEPADSRYENQITRTAPTIGGVYNSTEEGAYTITVYASSEASGYSYTYGGLEGGVAPVYPGIAARLGTRGLTITFPASISQITARDVWVVAVPNTQAAQYVENLENYQNSIETIKKNIAADTVSLANKETELAQALRGDTPEDRNLTVESAALGVAQARVDLTKNQSVASERRIVAPFSGTIEGIENVVAGATPTKNTDDPIDFGSLISDEFTVTFSLGAKDVEKIRVGGKVLVTLTSLPLAEPLEATIVEARSLPDSSSVAQYTVRAKIAGGATSTARLRDGMLADVEIVQQEKTDALRIPVSAVTYQNGAAYASVFDSLSDAYRTSIAESGIMRTESGAVAPTATDRKITLGLIGNYWAEVLSGLSLGEYIRVTSASQSAATTTVVEQRGGFGSGRPPGETSTRSSGSGDSSRSN